MNISIIIANYNTKQITKNCLESIFKQTNGISFEVILVDNNSSDGSAEYFYQDKRISYIQNENNYGFGIANNIAAKNAQGKYLLFLNSDTMFLNNAVKYLYDYFEKNDKIRKIGALGTYLLNERMNITNSYYKFPTISNQIKLEINQFFFKATKFNLFKNKSINYLGFKNDLEVDFISGAAMMVKKETFEKFNGFDPDYFLYFEETDLQKRMKKKGYKNILIEYPHIVHFEGQSSMVNYSYLKTKTNYIKSMFLYFRKNHSFFDVLLLKTLITPLLLRFFFLKKYNRRERKLFLKTIFLS